MTDRDGAVRPDRSMAVALTSFRHNVPEPFREWYDDLTARNDLPDGFEIVDEVPYRIGWAEPRPDPLPFDAGRHHRTGTCFDNESTEMRQACVDAIGAMLEATDGVVHEVRHQKSGYHTDLVYADLNPDGLRQRNQMTIGQEPLHDPLQRFRVWWHLVEHGPKPRPEAIENGRYADPGKNRRHLEWLLDHGYVARTATDHVDAVVPPSIATLHAVELKLRDWRTALEQADRANRCDLEGDWFQRNRGDRYGYADYRWVALDAGAITPALEHRAAFKDLGVGLLAVTEGGSVHKLIDAEHAPRGRYTRDRAYVESQIWARTDLDDYLTEATAEQGAGQNAQPSLAAFGSEP